VNRPLVVGIVGGVIVAIAISLTFFVDYGSKKQAEGTGEPAPQASSAPSGPKVPAPASVERPTPPSFDVVRVNPQGDTVIAGRAQPNAEVIVREGDREIGRVTADARGEWVLVPKQPLAPGSRELSLTARAPTGDRTSSLDKVVVVVPEHGKDIAGRATGEGTGALALRVPGSGGMGSTVLQKPGGDSAEAEPTAGRNGGPALSLDAVDYDDAGRLALSGHAAEGARVNAYLDNKLLGSGTAGGDRVWRVAPDATVPPGLYTLRIDQLDAGGKVTARVETKFVRAEPIGDLPRDSVVFVQPGNSLWRLARRVYGQGTQYTVIFEANRAQIRNPDLIYPGQVFMVPQTN